MIFLCYKPMVFTFHVSVGLSYPCHQETGEGVHRPYTMRVIVS